MTTLGLSRNNPWDLLPEHVPWLGLAPRQPDSGPLAFDTMEDGIRAGVRLCYTYQREGFDTPAKFVARFSPPPDNPTAEYTDNVCSWTGFAHDQELDFHDPDVLVPWARAVFRQEQGPNSITDAQIRQAKAKADL